MTVGQSVRQQILPNLRIGRPEVLIMVPLNALPPHARLRLSPITPKLEQAEPLLSAIDKLFAQFMREDRISAYGAEVLANGVVLAIAWVDNQGPLSGCSHDKLAQLLQTFEARSGCHLLAAPAIVIETTTGVRCVDRPGLKTLVTQQAINPQSIHWDLRCETLADWNSRGRQPASNTWLGPIMQRAMQMS